MKQKNIEKYMEKNARYWAKKLKIPLYKITKDNRGRRFWAYVAHRYGKNYLTYSSKYIVEFNPTKNDLLQLILHELGHLKGKWLANYVGCIKAEYQAEKQSLKWLKKYNHKYYLKYTAYMKKELFNPHSWWDRDKPYYGKAFRKIKEYQNNTK